MSHAPPLDPAVPASLRFWFVVHFVADIAAAIPLFVAPQQVLGFFGWPAVDPISTRLVAAALFGIGVYGVLARRNAVLVLMSIELMLNAVNVNLVAFSQHLADTVVAGQVFALFVITVAAAEVGIGLAIVILIFRNRETINVDEVNLLKW